ncbi:MAG: cation:proton antiporter [Brotaphodocola sp.]
MLTSLALIFLVGLIMAAICQQLKLPRIIGMLLSGILLGPYVLNFLDPSILGISSELRKMALVVILIKAGLSLDIADLKKIGRPAVLMSFLPALSELLAFVLFAPLILKTNLLESAIMGAVLSAVSPAVVVPRMVSLMEEQRGTNKKIPQLILAGASMDDVFVIVIFSTLISMAQGNGVGAMAFFNIPISIVLGLLLGGFVGAFLAWFFETNYMHQHHVRNSMKVIIILGTAFLLLAIEEWLEPFVALSGLLAIMSMALILAMRSTNPVVERLKAKYGKLWIAAEVILFVLVGAAVDIRYTLSAGIGAVFMIFIGLFFRAAGVFLCTTGTNLNKKERLYCIIAYLPKATVQAAIGSVPLSLGLPCGNLVLSVAVIAILITAPMGAILMDSLKETLLEK